MAISSAQKRAIEKYNAKTYDKITFRVYKGEAESISKFAAEHGMSINSFIYQAIQEKMERMK